MPKLSFTKASVANTPCPPDKGKVEFFDTALPGFGLEVRATEARTFFVRYYDAFRKKRQFKIGDAKLISLTDARSKAKEVLRKVELGEDPLSEKAEKRVTPTFAEFVMEKYLPFVKHHKRSWRNDESRLRHHILPAIGHLRLAELEPQHFSDIQAKLLDSGRAPATSDGVIVLCRYICNCALAWKTPGMKSNPTKGIPLLNVDNRIQRCLTAAETARLLATLELDAHARYRPIVLLALLTGARRGEVLHARFEEFNLEQRVWRIPKTKSGRPRTVPLSSEAIDLIRDQRLKTNSAYFCANPDTGRPYASGFSGWRRICRDANLPDLRMHDLRHSFASYLVNNGRTLYEVQRILGHSNIKITERYAHLSDESLRAAADTVGTVFRAAQAAHPTMVEQVDA
jgi:integrase